MAKLMGRLLLIAAIALSCSAKVKSANKKNIELALDLSPDNKTPPKKQEQKYVISAICARKEPKVIEVVERAWEEAGLNIDWDKSVKTRVRVSGWLPKISAGVSKDMGDRWDYRYEPGTPRVDQLHQDDGLRWDAGLSWDLSRTVYNPAELQVAKESSNRARERQYLSSEIVRLFYLRRKLMITGLPKPGTKAALDFEQATATLNAWTNRRFENRWCRLRS